VGGTVVASHCGAHLRRQLVERGYRVTTTPLSAFLRSGGAAFCLTLRLDWQSHVGAIENSAAVA
jgi:N-dimethylarginine dimethylaminohydrolase